MNKRHAVGGIAVATDGRLGNTSAVHLHASAERAHLTAEKCLLHLRDELRGADHHATDSDELVNI